jgi:arsenite methyltransferase
LEEAMSAQLVFDEEAARRIESIYLIGDAVRRRRIVREALAASAGERILDVGCGPGFYCVELLEDVGPSGSVVGVDSSAAMLTLAARRCAGFNNIELREADATAVPVEDAGFDAAISVQVQEYVRDIDTSLAELHRALCPGGRVVVFDIDWTTLSVHTEEPRLTRRVLDAWDEHLAHRSLPRTLASRLRSAGFEDVRMEAHPFVTIEFDRDSYGAAVVPFIGAFVAGRQGITEEEAQAWVAEQRRLGERGEFYFAVIQSWFTARRRR